MKIRERLPVGPADFDFPPRAFAALFGGVVGGFDQHPPVPFGGIGETRQMGEIASGEPLQQ